MNGFFRVLTILAVCAAAAFLWLKFRPVKQTSNNPLPEEVAISTEPARAPAGVKKPSAPDQRRASQPAAGGEIEEESARTWTSRDGRTMKADYISSDQTSVKVKRSDGFVFTIQLNTLSDADTAWVASQPKPINVAPTSAEPNTRVQPQISQPQLDKLIANFPKPPSLAGNQVTNELQQLHAKYHGMVKLIQPASIEPNLKMIRSTIDDDIKTLIEIAQTKKGDASDQSAAENTIQSARRSVSWLQGPLSMHLQTYDALLATAK